MHARLKSEPEEIKTRFSGQIFDQHKTKFSEECPPEQSQLQHESSLTSFFSLIIVRQTALRCLLTLTLSLVACLKYNMIPLFRYSNMFSRRSKLIS